MNIDDALTQRIRALRSQFEKRAQTFTFQREPPRSRPSSPTLGFFRRDRGEPIFSPLQLRPKNMPAEISPAELFRRNIYRENWPEALHAAEQYRQQHPDVGKNWPLGEFSEEELTRTMPLKKDTYWGWNFPSGEEGESISYPPADSKLMRPRTIPLPLAEELGHSRQPEDIPVGRAQNLINTYVGPGKNVPRGAVRGIPHAKRFIEFPQKIAAIRQFYQMKNPDAETIRTQDDFRHAWEWVADYTRNHPDEFNQLEREAFPFLFTKPEEVSEKARKIITLLGPAVVKAPRDRRPRYG